MLFRALLVTAAVAASPSFAAAQSLIRPEPAPTRVAGNEAWYRAGEPVTHRGDPFYPGGTHVFFNPSVMVLAGEFRGVPIYVDPTIETGSIVYVPIGSGLMQPYERLRAGELAGTSGSRTPSFPPASATTLDVEQPVGTAGVAPVAAVPADPVTAGTRPVRTPAASRVVTIAPKTSRGPGIWIDWNGEAWRASGGAVRVGAQLVAIGMYNGRTVYRGAGSADEIWIETQQGLVTPWRKR